MLISQMMPSLQCFIVLLQIILVMSDCSKKFEGKCFCGKVQHENVETFIVNCTNSRFTDTSVLDYLPEEVQTLIFTGNYLTTLPWNVLGKFNDFSSLKYIDMSNNHIREIRGKSFHHIQNVETLILNHNNLSISRDDDEINHHHPRVFSNFINLNSLHLTNAFADNTTAELSDDLHDIFVNSNLTKLTKLHLEQNEISMFSDPRVFCDLPSLRDLHLGDNLLKEINFNVKCLKNLRFLDLERNKFERLRDNDLEILNELQHTENRTIDLTVDFTHNPFICDCGIKNFQNWLEETKVIVRNEQSLLCYREGHYQANVLELPTSKCKNKSKSETGHTVTLVFLLILLIFFLLGLIGALLYVSKDKYRNMLRPVLNSISKKVQYSTIKDEECPEVHV